MSERGWKASTRRDYRSALDPCRLDNATRAYDCGIVASKKRVGLPAAKAKKKLSPGARLRRDIGDAKGRIRELERLRNGERDSAKRLRLDKNLAKAVRRLDSLKEELASLDDRMAGGPKGLTFSVRGVLRIGGQRKVGDSQASNRRHRGFRG